MAAKRDWNEDLQQDLERLVSVGEECISEDELKQLILARGRDIEGPGFRLYDGFEPSGRMHIAQGVFKAMNVNKCTFPGTNSTFVFWVADWFALMNDKMGGDLDKIKTVGKYLIEVWKAAGMDLTHVEFKWASEEITSNADKYWPTMLDVARRFNVTRIKKCCQIMGRLEGSLTSAQVLYPLMQCTDIFFLKADICQLGVDQRKVNMLAREYCDAAGIRFKPIILSHHMLYGLKEGQAKMSKSDPDSAVFMEDSADDVHRKIMKAYCPNVEKAATQGDTEEESDAGKASMQLKVDNLKNPCLDYVKNIIFSPPGATFSAGGKDYDNFDDVKKAFLSGTLIEEELKQGLIDALNGLLEPVRSHFTENENAKTLLEKVQSYKREAAAGDPEKKPRHLDLVSLGKVEKGSLLVFAPLPSSNPTLQDAVATLELLGSDQTAPKILFLSDWSARVCNACLADTKAIQAYYTILLSSMKALDPEVMSNTSVVYQSEAILSDPSNYWINVINVGRHFMLDQVMGPHMNDSACVGFVIARLMQVADVVAVSPAKLPYPDDDASVVMTKLVEDFYREKLPLFDIPTISSQRLPSLRLQPERESIALATDHDEYFLLDDPKMHGKSKMKKAFCEPGNIGFCPPIDLAFSLLLQRGQALHILRSEENGGNRTYESFDDLQREFADGSLHPGDLKTAVGGSVVTILESISAGIKEDAETQKAAKTLKQLHKKMAKSKK